jgi:hypothetical protein
MSKSFGFNKLAEQVGNWLLAEWEWQSEEAGQMVGDTKIEKLLFQAVSALIQIGASEHNELMRARSIEDVERLKFDWITPGSIRLIAWPQAPIEWPKEDLAPRQRRVDFLFFAQDWASLEGPWRKLIVECDGHDFHERTKEQAARDRSKDRCALVSGYDCFRFTGSEIWRDPWKCAYEILNWANKDFGSPAHYGRK